MAQFFKFLFASCLGTALALMLLFFVGMSALVGMATSATETPTATVKPNSVLELNFDKLIPERTNNTTVDPFDIENPNIVGLTDIVKMIRTAKDDPDIKGIYLSPSAVMAGKATAATIHEALLDFKTSKKFILSYADFYSQSGYYLASTADSILMNPIGAVEFHGLSSTIMFYKNMLDKMDIKMKIFYCGKFKSATEPYRLDKMSPENKLQVRQYVTALNDIFMADVAKARNIPEAELRQVAERYDGLTATGAQKSRLIDRLAYEDEAFNSMKRLIGLDEKEKLYRISLEDYYKNKGKKSDLGAKEKIAILYAEGTLQDGDGGDPGNIYGKPYVKMLRKIRNDDKVKALVLRVNSPGGSVLASEQIYREILLFKASGRPVVVSMGDVAASGGYYIACPADSIFAEPNTITGSIGVFGMIPMLQSTLRENLGITLDSVKTSKFSAFGNSVFDFSPEEDALIQGRVNSTYEDFLQKVAKGRKKTRDQIDEIAQGRVWAGKKAKEIGLVDDLGGLDRALAAAASLAGLEKYRQTEYPQAKTGMEQFIERFMKKKDREDAVRAMILQGELKDLYPMYKSMQDLRESKGIIARIPYDIHVN
jgi:protease IV